MLPWNDPQRWQRLCSGADCPVCLAGRPADVVLELPTAYLTAPAAAILRGYCCLFHRRHVTEFHDLSPEDAAAFALDIRRVCAVVKSVTRAAKLNLASYGIVLPHLHCHVCPRWPGDRFEGRPLDFGDVRADAYAPGEHERYVAALRAGL
jgi:diadenosine tetraphosphate (Ap4A) HIT family hydrolase